MSEFINRKQFIAATQSLHCEPCRHQTACLNCDIGHMVRKVKNFPSADVAPVVHGHWKHKGWFDDECSICHSHYPATYKYCPNCGAKMDESEDSTDE